MGIVLVTEVISLKKSPEKNNDGRHWFLKNNMRFSQAEQKAGASWRVSSSAVLSHSCN